MSKQDKIPTNDNLLQKVESEKYLKRIVGGASIALTGSILSQVLGALSGIITTNALGVAHYGIYVLATSWMGLLADYSRLGFGTVIIRFSASYNAKPKKELVKGTFFYIIKIQLLISIILCCLLMIWAEEFCRIILNNTAAVPYIRFFSPAIILTSLYGSFIAFLDGMQNQKYSVLSSSIIGNLSNIFSLLLLLWLGYGIYAALGSSLIQDSAILLAGAYLSWKIFPDFVNRKISSEVEKKKIWSFALTTFIASLSYKYAFGLAIPFIGHYRSSVEVGLYAVAFSLQQLLFVPANAFSAIFNPIIAELFVKKEMLEIQHLYKIVTKWLLISCSPIAIILLLHSEPILSLFGNTYVNAAIILTILTATSFVVNLIGVSGHIINMIGKAKVNMINSIVTAIITISMFVLLIPVYGLIGAALAYSGGLLINNIIRTLYVYWTLKMHPFSFALVKNLLAALISFAVGEVVKFIVGNPSNKINIIIVSMISLAVYIGIIILSLNDDDKFIIASIRRKFKNKNA